MTDFQFKKVVRMALKQTMSAFQEKEIVSEQKYKEMEDVFNDVSIDLTGERIFGSDKLKSDKKHE